MITDLKPGDRFRLTEADGGYMSNLTVTTVFEGTVTRVDADKVFYGPNDYDYLVTDAEHTTWERIAPAEPKNLGAVVEFTHDGETVRVVRVGESFENDFNSYYWEDILGWDANPRVLHEGWDGK